MSDARSGRIAVLSHCLLNVHSLEEDLSLYRGLEEEVVQLLISKGLGLFQIPCPEMWLSGISRNPLPKDSYDHPKIRAKYRELAGQITLQLSQFHKKGYEITIILGAEGSPTCGIDSVGRWKDPIRKGRFPDDIDFVPGRGVFMEEFQRCLRELGTSSPLWMGVPGKSLCSLDSEALQKMLKKLEELL